MTANSVASFAAMCGAFLGLVSAPPSLSFPRSVRLVAVAAAADAQPAAQYRCPMHPTFTQDRKGDCPICGMSLVRVEKQGAASEPASAVIAISEEKQKVLGVVVAPVERSAGARSIRALGRVAPDDTRLWRLNAGANGSIRDVAPFVAGSRVRKGQVLGSFYSPEALPNLQLFVINNQGYDRLGTTRFKADGSLNAEGKGEDEADVGKKNSSLYKANIQQRIMQLENIGVSAEQRDEIVREGRIPDTIQMRAPADGVVLARNVSPGLKFERGFEFYRIADLRKVWILADVFLQDARHVRPGMRATVSVPEQDLAVSATVSEILPEFDAASRTLKVRLVADNPDDLLRPDMFVDVSLRIDLPAALAVPADAVLDSGLAKTVFVETAPGRFEARRVDTGSRRGDRVEIVRGLSAGERIVTSGNFFLDSETRMRQPLSGVAPASVEHEAARTGSAR